MKEKIEYGFKDYEEKLAVLDPKISNKATALAKGIMSVYGLTKGEAIEEGIKRALEIYSIIE